MARCMDVSKYEISDFSPLWIDQEFPNKENFSEIFDVMKFYLINSPCSRSSSRGTDISIWGKPTLVLLDRLKDEIGLVKGTNYDHGRSKPAMKELFAKYSLSTDFTSVKKDMVIFLDEGNVFENIFKHIRNSIAHSRWQKHNNWYYFEDGSDENINGQIYFCVTARMVLCDESLHKWKNLICNGPSGQELEKINLETKLDSLLDQLKKDFHGKTFTRKDAIALLTINNEMWKKLYSRGKKKSVIRFRNRKWEVV